MLDSHPGIHLVVVVQLMVIVDPFWVYYPEPLAPMPETVLFCSLLVKSDDNVSDMKSCTKIHKYIQLA